MTVTAGRKVIAVNAAGPVSDDWLRAGNLCICVHLLLYHWGTHLAAKEEPRGASFWCRKRGRDRGKKNRYGGTKGVKVNLYLVEEQASCSLPNICWNWWFWEECSLPVIVV